MIGPHLDQVARDVLDGDHALVTDPAGDDDNEEKAPGRRCHAAEGTHRDEGITKIMPDAAHMDDIESRECCPTHSDEPHSGTCRGWMAGTAQAIADASTTTSHAIEDLGDILGEMPTTAPLMAALDIVAASGHLRAAGRLLDQACRRIEEIQA